MNNSFKTVRGYELKRYSENPLTPSLEDYLEMIYRHCKDNTYIRIKTLSNLLNVKASSASKMTKKLRQLGLVDFEKYGIIKLTEMGKEKGKFLLDRHNIIENFLRFIGCQEKALMQTELIEHHITPSTVKNIEILCNFFNDNKDILDRYLKYRENH
ncbi:MAG: DtxR family transcriptional regulator [Tissierellia bacterium]|nr:DtxR family transcriptional regulator [Tissierellia bacterium]